MRRPLAARALIALAAAAALAGCGRNDPPPTAPPPVAPPTSSAPAASPSVGAQIEQGAERAGAAIDDATLTARIKSALIAHPDLKGLSIDVDTVQNVVSLNGTVATDAAKKQAEQIARGVEGVKGVNNNLAVKSSL